MNLLHSPTQRRFGIMANTMLDAFTNMVTPPATTPKGTVPAVPVKKNIVDVKNSANHGVVLFKQSDIDKIYSKSGPNAVGNEFQVHYWFINYRFTATDGSIIDVAVPTTFFNYPQQVNAAHIDFEMLDVGTISEKAQELHNHIYQPLIASHFQAAIESLLNVKFEVMSVALGTLHRHPGGSSRQGFSGTDYQKNPDNHGIVFPFETANELLPSFSGIMAVDTDRICRLAHNEYRLAKGTLGVDLVYQQGRCQAIVINDTQTCSEVEALLGVKTDTCYTKEDNSLLSLELVSALASIYKSVLTTFTSSTDLINPDNVTKKVYTAVTGKWGGVEYNYYSKPKEKKAKKKQKVIEIKSHEDLGKMSRTAVLEHLKDLDEILYPSMDASDEYIGLSIDELRIQAAANQLDYVDELLEKDDQSKLESLLTLDDKINALIDDGYIEQVLVNYEEETIDMLYEKLQLRKEPKALPPVEDKPKTIDADQYKREYLIKVGYSPDQVVNFTSMQLSSIYSQYVVK